MIGKRWDASSVTAQLRLTSLRLGQLQEKQDSRGAITRKDIATLLQQRNVSLARFKAQNLQREDALGDLLEILEMYVGQLLEHFQELDQGTRLSPSVIEAASTIIYATPYVGSKDLDNVSHLLAQHLGPEFAHSAMSNNDGHVAAIATRMATLSPSAKDLDMALHGIALEYGVTWVPDPLRQDILKLVSEILDPKTAPVVDLPSLRRLCRCGIPDEPRWLRPRIWKLLLGVLPVVKVSWAKESESQRNTYYDLVQRLLDPISVLPSPDLAPNSLDAMLLDISRQLSTTPPSLFADLAEAPDSFSSCPLDDDAKDEIKLSSAKNLNLRLDILQTANPERASPLRDKPSSVAAFTPEISLSSPDVSQGKESNISTILLSFKPFVTHTVHPKHLSALLRLLYMHASINPGNIPPHIVSLLVPLYVILNHEVLPDDLAHVEADTFWLFEAMVGEFSELQDAESRRICMKGLSDRLAWADSDLFIGLQAQGLDPVLSHYSYNWLAPLLTHTMPFSSVIPIWDAIFSCPTRSRDVNSKIDHLLNVCTAMLIRAKDTSFQSDRNNYKPPSVWLEDVHPPPYPLHREELGDAKEILDFLQLYPIDAAGGIDRVLQDASDLALRRDEETKHFQKETLSLGARIKATMWKGLTNQELSPGTSPEVSEDESTDETVHENSNNTENPTIALPSLRSRLATTVWRGITNQTSMEPPPSPGLPISPSMPFLPYIRNPIESRRQGSLHPMAMADRIRDSDAVAAITKAGSNWRAKSILGVWASYPSLNKQEHSWSSLIGTRSTENSTSNDEARRPLSIDRNGAYTPLPRPQQFRPARNSIVSPHNIIQSPKEEGNHEDGVFDKRDRLQSLLAASTRTSSSRSTAKLGPRPLLLSSSKVLTSPPIRPVSRSAGSSPALPDNSQWADVIKLKGHSLHRDSISSISSLSPSDALRSVQSNQSGWDSDMETSSRRIPLNRKSVSPMAPSFRRQGHPGSLAVSSNRGLLSPSSSDQVDSESRNHIKKLDSASLTSQHSITPSSAVIQEPLKNKVQMKDPGLAVISSNQAVVTKSLTGEIVPLTLQVDDIAQTPSPSPRLGTEQYAPPPLDLNLKNNSRHDMERKPTKPNRLTAEWRLDDHEIVPTARSSGFKADDSHNITTPIPSISSRLSWKASAEIQNPPRNTLTDRHETRVRKASSGPRPRKSSIDIDQREIMRRESSAEEGDGEGYDDLLSAYESENSRASAR